MIDSVSEKKFLLLKKRLDALHYTQSFSPDSAPLVESLLNDLIKTTEGFQNLKSINEEIKNTANKADLRLEPLKKENRNLLKDNNELHEEIMRVKEDAARKEGRWNITFKSLQDDKADLKHVIQMKDASYARLEEENASIRRKLEILIKKQYLGQGKGLENVPAEFRSYLGGKSVKFDMTHTLRSQDEEGSISFKTAGTGQIDDKTIGDQFRRADEKINELKEELKSASHLKVELEDEIEHLRNQVSNRDKEIKRLQARVDIGDNLDKIGTDYNIQTNNEKIEKLNAHIDYLAQQNANLDSTVKHLKKELSVTDPLRVENMNLRSTIHDLTQKNEELGNTIKNKDRVLEKMSASRNLAESQLFEKKDRQILDLENEVVGLTKRLDNLLAENSKFKLESSQASQTIAAYNSDKLAFSEIIQELKQTKIDLESKMDELENELEKKRIENQGLQDDLNMYQGKVQNLQREVDLIKVNASKNSEDQIYNQQLSSNLRSRIRELESENLTLASQKKDLENQVERQIRQREHAEGQLEIFKNENYQNKANVDTTNLAKQRFQTLFEESQKDVAFLKKDIRDLEAKLLEEKRTNTELDIKCHDYFNNLRASQDKIKSLEMEVEMLNEQLAVRLQDIRNVEGERMEAEREISVLKANKSLLEDQNDRNKKLKEEINILMDEKTRYLKQVESLKSDIRELNEKVMRQEEIIRKEKHANHELNIKIDSLALESEAIENNLKRAREREHEYNDVVFELDNKKRAEKNLLEEIEKLRKDIKKQETMIANGVRQVDNLNLEKTDMLRENRALKDEIAFLKSDENDIKTKSIKLQERINNYEISVADLRDEKLREERKITELEEELRRAKNDFERERRHNGELNDQVQQLKTLAESLENTRKELLSKLQNKNQERNLDEGERNRLHEEIKLLKERIKSMERDSEDMRTTLVEVDRERDVIQSQLDDKSEDLERVQRRFEDLLEENRHLKERGHEVMASNNYHVNRLQELETQLSELHRKNKTLLSENSELKRKLNANEVEIESLRNEVNLITREKESLNRRIVDLVEEQDRVKGSLNNVNTQERVVRQNLRAAEMERDDLVNNYKAVCVENERLKRNAEDLSNENLEAYRKVKQAERDISYLKGQIQQFEQKESQYMNELSSYERKISGMARELANAEYRVKEGNEAKERLTRSYQKNREVAEGIEYSREDLQKRLARNEHEKTLLNEQIRDLMSERDYLKRQLDEERRRAQELEETLSEERKKQYRQDINIQNLENEKIELQRNIENCEKRIQTLQNSLAREADLETFNSRGGSDSNQDFGTMRSINILENKLNEKNAEVKNLINEQRGLRDENSQLRLSLYKAESQREEIEKKLKLQASFDSTLSYDKLFSEGLSSKDRSERERDWERPNFKTGPFRKNFEEASLSSQYIKEKGRTLGGYYHDQK